MNLLVPSAIAFCPGDCRVPSRASGAISINAITAPAPLALPAPYTVAFHYHLRFDTPALHFCARFHLIPSRRLVTAPGILHLRLQSSHS